MKRKSQANIITIVLIILLVLAAVIIVWQGVKMIVETPSEKIRIDQFATNMEIKEAKLYVTGGANVSVFRDIGKGEIESLKFIFIDKNGASYTIERSDSIPGELETKIYSFNSSDLPFSNSAIKSVSVYPVSGDFIGFETKEPESGIKTDSSGSRLLDYPAGLVSWWKFDGNFDDSAGSNHGTANGNPNLNGNVLNLNGSNYVNCGTDNSLNLTENFSIGAWVMYSNQTKPGWPCTFIVSKTEGNGNKGYDLFTSSNRIRFQAANESGNCPPPYFDIETFSTYHNGQWHQITAVYEKGVNATLYVDGNLVLKEDYSPSRVLPSIANLTIGKRSSYPDFQFFNGSIDDVMIFNRPLSAAEILAVYNNQKK